MIHFSEIKTKTNTKLRHRENSGGHWWGRGWLGAEEGMVGDGEMGKGSQKVQASSYEISKPWNGTPW